MTWLDALLLHREWQTRSRTAWTLVLATSIALPAPAVVAQEECVATEERPGLCNPLGEPPARPLLRDDEAVVIGFDGSTQTIAVQDGLADEPGLRVSMERTAGEPRVAKGGRVLGIPAEQLVLVQREGSGMRLELLALAGCSDELSCPVVVGSYDFTPANPDSEVALAIANLDDEPDEEIVLAYETERAGEARVRLAVLSFRGVARAPVSADPAAPELLADATLDHDHANAGGVYNLGLLRQQDGGANRLRVAVGTLLPGAPPAILVAHATPDARLAALPISFAALVDGDTTPVVGAREAPALTAEAADAGGWEVAVGPFASAMTDSLFVVRQQADSLDVRALRVELAPTARCQVGDGDICDSGPMGGMPCTSDADCPSAQDALLELATPHTGPLCTLGPNCPSVVLSTAARLRSSMSPAGPPWEWNELYGLSVLVQSARGPIVQRFVIMSGEPARVQPVDATAFAWPRGSVAFDARGTFDQAAPIELSVANVVHHRATANRYGQGVGGQAFDPFHYDRQPSLYLSLPDGEPWSTLGRLRRIRFNSGGSDAELETGPHCDGPSCELVIIDGDDPIEAPPSAVMTTADVDGDSAFYRIRASSAGPENAHDLYLSQPRQLTIHGLRAPEIILEEPPKHVDYLRTSGEVHNVSQSPEFSVAYRNAVTESVQVESEATTAIAFGEETSDKVEAKLSAAVKIFTASLTSSLSQRIKSEIETSYGMVALSSSTTTLTQTFETSTDDQLFVVERPLDIWRFPAIGLAGADDEPAPKQPFFELVVPGAGAHSAESGRNSALYNPRHINGNVLSYPRFDAVSEVTGAASAELRSFTVGGECVDMQCSGGPEDGLACTSALQCAAPDAIEDPIWAESSFDLSADTTTTLAFSESGSLGSKMSYSHAVDVSTSFSVSGELGASYMGFGATASGTHDYTVHEGHTFTSSEVSTNTTSSENEIALRAPPLGAPEETYSFAPAFYFERTGAVKVTHHVELPVGPASFWTQHYSGPDPALHLPHRIVCEGEDCRLNQGAARHAMKGLFIRYAEDDARDRHLVTSAPPAGTRLRLEAQVWNLGVSASTGEVTVRFEASELAQDGRELGPPTRIGDATIEDIAPGAVELAAIEWDTTGFGDAPSGDDRTYRVRVTLDPEDAIEDETHEWLDRDGDPLLGEDGEPLDPRTHPTRGTRLYLEKGQNNEGWGALTIAPSDASCDDRPDPCGPGSDLGGGRDAGLGDAGANADLDGGALGDAGGAGDAGDAGLGDAGSDDCNCSAPGASARPTPRGLLLLLLPAALLGRRATRWRSSASKPALRSASFPRAPNVTRVAP